MTIALTKKVGFGRLKGVQWSTHAARPLAPVVESGAPAVPVTEVGAGGALGDGRPAVAASGLDALGPAGLSFERVFAELAPYVLRVLPRLGVHDADVDDVAQEVFLAVHHGLPQFEGRSRVRTWVYGICLRVAGNYRRRAHRRREVRGLDIDTPQDASQGADLERERARQGLNVALAQLSEAKREVFVLFEIEELSMAEVAQVVGCPLFTAYARLYAARREMKQALIRLDLGGRP